MSDQMPAEQWLGMAATISDHHAAARRLGVERAMSDILAQIDAAIEDAEGYIEWHGSSDSAEWHADGSHEVQIGGHYYATDQPTWHPLLERPISPGGICGERNIMPIGRSEAYLPHSALEDMRQRLDHQAMAELAEVITRIVMRGDLDLRSMPVTPTSATPTSDSNA